MARNKSKMSVLANKVTNLGCSGSENSSQKSRFLRLRVIFDHFLLNWVNICCIVLHYAFNCHIKWFRSVISIIFITDTAKYWKNGDFSDFEPLGPILGRRSPIFGFFLKKWLFTTKWVKKELPQIIYNFWSLYPSDIEFRTFLRVVKINCSPGNSFRPLILKYCTLF